MMSSIWDLVGQLMYISSLLGVVPNDKIQEELEALKKKFQEALDTDGLYALYRRECTGGRDWPEILILGVFTSRAAAAMYLCDELASSYPGVLNEYDRAAILKNLDTYKVEEDDTSFLIIPVLHGMDPKKAIDDHG